MDIRLAPIGPDQFLDFARAGAIGFGGQIVDEDDIKQLEHERAVFEFDRSLAAFDGDQIVGTGTIFSFNLTTPGARVVPAAGVSWITVVPTHRRQGILTQIMRRQLSDTRDRGEPLAILWASESIIYGRFGYGSAATHLDFEIDPRHSAFQHAPPIDGRVRLAERETMADLLPPIYDLYRRQQPGAVTRNPAYWQERLLDLPSRRRGASPFFAAVYRSAEGTDEGYALYRIKENWEGGFAQNTLRVHELVSSTSAAYAALWQFCLSIDLVTGVSFYGATDEVLRWMLADPRRLTARGCLDNLWVRLVDLPGALASRRYALEDRLVLRVHDEFCPGNSGTYSLEGGRDGAACRASRAEPDLELSVADLGAAYLGGVRFSTLARAGRVHELRAGSLQRADAMFRSDRDPRCITDF